MHTIQPARLGAEPVSPIYGQTAVRFDEIITAVIELPEALKMAKLYAIGMGVLLVYVAVQVSKR